MKRIVTHGIYFLEALRGSGSWYWGMDYTSGDLYEAEELFRDGHPVRQNRMALVRYPDGAVFEPVRAQPGQYLGRPVYHDGKIILLLADFPQAEFRILAWDARTDQIECVAVLPRSIAEDCYNLHLETGPLMLTRQADGRFQILWPDRADFPIGDRESFDFCEGDRLYFAAWHEDPDRADETVDEIVVRDRRTGAVLERTAGITMTMPDGQHWALM